MKQVQWWARTSGRKAVAENRRRRNMEAPVANAAPAPIMRPVPWYSGRQMYSRSAGVQRSPALPASVVLASSRRLESTAAFGKPVVPEVKMYIAVSPSVVSAVSGGFSAVASALAAAKSTAQLAGAGALASSASGTTR